MKKKKIINQYCIVSITLFIFFFTACNKSSDPLQTIIRPNQEFPPEGLEYVNVTPGKYLIYKDSASGILDSVVVTKSLLEKIYHPADTASFIASAFYTQEFSLTLTKVDGTLQTPWFTGIADTFSAIFVAGDFLLLNEIYHLSGTGTDHTTSAFSNTFPVYYSTIPAITIEGNNYTNVIFGVYDAGLEINDPGYTKRTFYWAKGIGIIKREIITTGGAIQTHTLLRHN